MLNTLSNADRMLRIGKIGEDIVSSHFKYAQQTEDWFDSEKDGTIDGIKYEVKTLVKNQTYNGFWLEPNQFHKVDGNDALFFVQIPFKENDPALLLLMTNHRDPANYQEFMHKGVKKRNYLFTKCMKLGIISDNRATELYELSFPLRTYGVKNV
jgi:hypothetical protein